MYFTLGYDGGNRESTTTNQAVYAVYAPWFDCK